MIILIALGIVLAYIALSFLSPLFRLFTATLEDRERDRAYRAIEKGNWRSYEKGQGGKRD
jgi:hypothetical protein